MQTEPVEGSRLNQGMNTGKQSPFLQGGFIDLKGRRFSTNALGENSYETNRPAYDRFNHIMANDGLFGKLTLREYLDKTITSPVYENRLTDNIRVDIPYGKKASNMYEGSRKDILTSIISEAKEHALVRLRKENPALDAALKLHEQNQGDAFSSKGQDRRKALNAPLEGK